MIPKAEEALVRSNTISEDRPGLFLVNVPVERTRLCSPL
jgi:hypothetical protein